MNNQAYIFIIFIINGIIIGFLFDCFRIIRKSFKTSDMITYIEDILFWIIAGITTLYFIFIYNNGEIRFYIFLGILIGILFYMLTISKFIIKISVSIISFLKDIVTKAVNILVYPIKILFRIFRKTLLRPISFIFINIRTLFTKSRLNLVNLQKKCKNLQKQSK